MRELPFIKHDVETIFQIQLRSNVGIEYIELQMEGSGLSSNLMSWNCLSLNIFASAMANPDALNTCKKQQLA